MNKCKASCTLSGVVCVSKGIFINKMKYRGI